MTLGFADGVIQAEWHRRFLPHRSRSITLTVPVASAIQRISRRTARSFEPRRRTKVIDRQSEDRCRLSLH